MAPADPLLELLDEARVGEASGRRGRERHLRRAAEEDARLTGLLVDLAERRTSVTVRTSGGAAHHGAVAAVGADFCVVRTGGAADGSADVFIALGAVATVRPHHGEPAPPATGDRPPPTGLRLLDVLGAAAGERLRVVLVTDGERLSGELLAVGADVLTVRLDGDGRAVCYVSAPSVREAVLLRSG